MANHAKDIGEKIASVLEAWADLRPAKTFAGMTLAQFTAKIQPSLDARAAIDKLNDQMTAALVVRDTADVESNKQLLLLVNAVKGDPAEGEDGELYAAMGYVRKSERASGLTKKTKAAAPAAAAH
jgi:hypothetical protein